LKIRFEKHHIFILFALPVFLVFQISDGKAQRASIQGLITDYSTGQVLFGANIVLQSPEDESVRIGTSAGSDGFYRLGSVEPGRWFLSISFIGYEAYRDTLTFRAGENKTVNIALREDDTELDELVVARIITATRRVEGAQRITPAEIRRVPGPAVGDIASYLQTMPGVVSMGDRGGQVFIRGGSPSENMVLFDGALIYQPTHIVGFFSPIPGELVSGADFYAGGFAPKYSGRLSSVLDVHLRHGDLYNTSGSASVSPFAADIFAEGPMSEGVSSWVFSARNSLIEQTSSWYPIEQQPLSFQSQFLKGSFIQDDTRCSMMAMHTFDRGRMDFDERERIQWRNFVVGGRCVALPEGTGTLMTTNVNLSRFSNSVSNVGPFGFTSSAMRLNLDLDIRRYSGNVRFDYGAYTRLKFLNYNLGEKFAGFDADSFTQFVAGGHVQAAIPAGRRLNLQPGLGFSYNGEYGMGLEPRFRFSWQPFGRESEEFSGSAGYYLQPITGVSDIRDVSSVFVAWMSAPVGSSQMKAFHSTIGWQQTISNHFTWSVETYYKRMQNQAIPVWNTIAEFTTELALADGRVYGSDLRLEYNRGRFYGMLGYGYNWILYESAQDHFNVWFGEPVQEFHPPHDRRHQVNSLFSIDFGSYTAGARWQLGSGLPFTRPIGFDEILDFRERLPDVNRDMGIRRVIIDKPYQGRMPIVHRLDISIERSYRLSASGSNINLQLGAINAYNKTNIFYYDVFMDRRINQLTFSPYLTLKLEVK
jgi:hypothetical protein